MNKPAPASARAVKTKSAALKPEPATTNPAAAKIMQLLNDALWLLALLATLYGVLSLASYHAADPAWSHSHATKTTQNIGGMMGAYLADIGYYLTGLSAWWGMVAAIIWLAYHFGPMIRHKAAPNYHLGGAAAGLLCLLLASPVLERLTLETHLAGLPLGAGGWVGLALTPMLSAMLGLSGSLLLCFCLMVLGVSLLLQVSWLELIERLGLQLEWLWMNLVRKPQHFVSGLPRGRVRQRMVKAVQALNSHPIHTPEAAMSNRRRASEPAESIAAAQSGEALDPIEAFEPDETDVFPTVSKEAAPEPAAVSGSLKITAVSPAVSPKKSVRKEALDPLEASELPSLEFLRESTQVQSKPDATLLQKTAELIETKLAEFNVGATVVSAATGPVITRFEIELAQGVKGSQVVNLGRDLARALAVQSVRVVETIAGKHTMGIELPNTARMDVVLRDIIGAGVFQDASSHLTLALGKDISGLPVVADLAKMPHLLVAGTTGSGKSVAINSMILSLLYKATPQDVRLIMVDPKMLELSVYQDIPHLLAPVVTDMKEAGNALNWCVAEMERRYKLLAHAGVRSLESFNEKVRAASQTELPLLNPFSPNPDDPEPLATLPKIVVVIDELADLMMVEGKKVEQQIARLAQKARAAGIHLILATQRPSVDVITGLIKANIPTRMSFQVSSKIDSRTILDQMGAENLLGKGDMLFLPPGTAEPTRLHGAFVSDEEVHELVDYLKAHSSPDYIEGLLQAETTAIAASGAGEDELFDQAVSFILESRKTSISSLQRHLRIGYNRAANLMEEIERAGVVTAPDVGGSRKILSPRHE